MNIDGYQNGQGRLASSKHEFLPELQSLCTKNKKRAFDYCPKK